MMLEGARNFRDIGGMASSDGRRVRSGIFFRSEHLANLTESDIARLENLGIKLVFDLRSAGERLRLPSRLPLSPRPQVVHMDINQDANAAHETFLRWMRQDSSPSGAVRTMTEIYRGHPVAFESKLGTFFDCLLAGSFPAVIHCHSGKDRTGFLTAMLLLALDVPQEAIFEDYMASLNYLDPVRSAETLQPVFSRMLGQPLSPASMREIMSVRREYLEAAFNRIVELYGTTAAYLERAAGLTEPQRDVLKENMLA